MITKIGVNGMSWGHCSKSVKEAIEQIDGVEKVDVSLQEKTATIISSGPISSEQLKAAIEEEGYKFTGIL